MPQNHKAVGGMANHNLISEYKATDIEAGADPQVKAFLAEIGWRDFNL